MRERIKNSNLLTDLIGSIDKIGDLNPDDDTHSNQLAGIKAQNDVRLKLLNKVLPELKATELDISGGLKLVAIDMTGIDPDQASEPDDPLDDE